MVRRVSVQHKFHHHEFDSTDALVRLKREKNIRISVVLPTLNEAQTIGSIVSYMRSHFTGAHPLIDEIIVVDGNSEDETVSIASQEGASVYLISEIVPDVRVTGKGVALWKSQFVTSSDILVFIDTDIFDFDKRFVNGLLGPLLHDESLMFSKAFYKRPLYLGSGRYENYGGRVTEILVRPFLSALIPDLASIIQPLAGEYAIRRSVLNKLPFWSGYGVEIGILLDVYLSCGIDSIAQVDMEDRHHRNRSVLELSRMAFGILHVMLQKFERMGKMSVHAPLYETLQCISDNSHSVAFSDIELQPFSEFEKKEVIDVV
jgi:glucosyl-3-phosphoglycerate synthase